jgi:two-component system chemotaxis response regulator CheB
MVLRRRVLVVEDDPDVLDVVVSALEDEPDLVARGFGNAEAALAALPDVRPDVVLLDLALPGMSGAELAELLRWGNATAGLPVVAMTATHQLNALRTRARRAGCIAIVDKPFLIGDLVRTLRSAMDDFPRPMPAYEALSV